MPIDAGSDPLIDRLVVDLRPVRPRSLRREALVLAGLGVLQLAVFIAVYGLRPDFMLAMRGMGFWWKLLSMAVIAGLALAALLRSLNPANGVQRGLARVAVAAVVALAAGWLVDAGAAGRDALLARLDWREGLHCVWMVVVLALPAAAGLTLLMRRGAPADRQGSALAAGLAAAAWAAFVFTFSCPNDDPLYVAVWYSVAVAVVAVPLRLLLPRLTRW